MKNVLLTLLILIVALVLVWLVWTNWGSELSLLPEQFAQSISRLLSNFTSSLSGFGSGIRESFKMPVD
jgi:hypothetical protein